MNSKLRQSLSLAMLTLTLVSAGIPATSALANPTVLSDQAITVTETPTQPVTGQVTGGSSTGSVGSGDNGSNPTPVPTPAPTPGPTKPKPPIDPSKLPTSLPKTFEIPTEPAVGEPGARLKLSGASNTNNTRDLGGYVTADGKWKIKDNRLLRSANLSKFSDGDIKVLQAYSVKHIVDMRTPSQVKSGKDKIIPGTTWENISILGNFADGGYNVDSNGDYSGDKAHDGGFYNHQLEFSASAMNGYNKFLSGLLTQSGATLFHCSSGKDRTGIASVLIMSSLGMDTKDIAKDYMLSQTYEHPVRYSWLKEYYREINTYYKNMPNYLVNGLHFSKYQQEVLKSKYLVSNDKEERAYPAPKTPGMSSVTPVQPDKKPEVTKPEVAAPVKPMKDKRVKVVFVKKIKKAQFVHLKRHRAYFYDLRLKHKVGMTKIQQAKTKWKLVKRAKLQINGKTVTYVQIKSPHGFHRWIQVNAVLQIKD